MKKVISKIVKSLPFVEHRLRNDLLKNKYRRFEDILPENIAESRAIKSATYEITSGNLKSSNNKGLSGRLLDSYA